MMRSLQPSLTGPSSASSGRTAAEPSGCSRHSGGAWRRTLRGRAVCRPKGVPGGVGVAAVPAAVLALAPLLLRGAAQAAAAPTPQHEITCRPRGFPWCQRQPTPRATPEDGSTEGSAGNESAPWLS